MTSLTFCASIIGLFAVLNFASVLAEANEEHGILECLYETNTLACAKKRADTELDRIEVEVTGKQSSVTFSKVLEEAGEFMVDGARSILGLNDETEEGGIEGGEDNSEEGGNGERQARRKKFGKKKKKQLMKMVPLMMLAKAKIGLVLQMISTHFQMKFFVIAIVSLVINVARFWLDIKNQTQKPSKVIYYEQAHHQHHYDNEDAHGGYWGRSGEASPDELSYNGYASDH